MRLVCPNCEAKYEVPDDAIPDAGRDVQCTNCNHTWFQMRGRAASPVVAPAPVAPVVDAEPPASVADALTAAVTEPEVAPVESVDATAAVDDADPVASAVPDAIEDMAAGEPEAMPEGTEATSDEAAPGNDAEPPVQALPETDPALPVEAAASYEAEPLIEAVAGAETQDQSVIEGSPVPDSGIEHSADVADVIDAGNLATDANAAPDTDAAPELSPEAETTAPPPEYAVDESVLAILREEAEREANARRAEALESQTELGLEAALSANAVSSAETKPSARRDLLPDVEEINSTLRPSEMQDEADGGPDFVAPPPEAPRGFRSGFLTLMTVAILATALYIAAPRLAVVVPALSGPLESYVAMIDSLRLGLDGMMRSATVAISDG